MIFKRTLEERLTDIVENYMIKYKLTLPQVKKEIEDKVCKLSKMERDHALKS